MADLYIPSAIADGLARTSQAPTTASGDNIVSRRGHGDDSQDRGFQVSFATSSW